MDDSVGSQIHTFQIQIKSVFDDVKKGKEELKLKSAGVEGDLESVKKSAAEKADELTALKLRVDQIKEAIKADELARKKEAEMKYEKLMGKIRERKEEA